MEVGTESGKPPEKDVQTPVEKLFKDYGEMAVLRGNIVESPRDSTFPPGNDGTLDNNGIRRYPFTLSLENERVLEVIRQQGVNLVEIFYTPEVILDNLPMPENVMIMLHEASGIEKYITFARKADGSVTVETEIQTDAKELPTRLLPEERSQTLDRLYSGDESLQIEEEPIRDYAEQAVMLLLEPIEGMDTKDVVLLQKALPEIEEKTRR